MLQVLLILRKTRELKSGDFPVQVGSYLWIKILNDYNVSSQNWDYRFQLLLDAVLSEYRNIRTIVWE